MQDGCGGLNVSIDNELVDNLYQLLFTCMTKLFKKMSPIETEGCCTYGLHACQYCRSSLTAYPAEY
jgi:hypothetical protein